MNTFLKKSLIVAVEVGAAATVGPRDVRRLRFVRDKLGVETTPPAGS